jgi:catecholate siderophore receptor
METGENAALRINAFAETLANDRDFYDGDRLGINPTLRVRLSDKTILDLSYEMMDHERFIDRGIPTGADGAPVDSLRDIVFGSASDNITTLEANILRGTLSHQFSDTMAGVLNVHYGDYEKLYQNLYASGYSAENQTVTLDGYHDPTERTHMVLNGHVTGQFSTGGMNHTLLIGGEHIDTQSENLRYNTLWSTSGNDKETFPLPTNGTQLDLTENAAGEATSVSYTTADAWSSKTETDITVTSLFVQDQIAVTDKLQVLLGARLDNIDATVKDIKNSSQASRKDEEISPRFGLIYKPQSNLSFYASTSESFIPRSGEQYKKLNAKKGDIQTVSFDPDVFENTEFGFKWNASEALLFAASFFEAEQVAAQRDETGEAAEIVGLEVDGVEIEISGRIGAKTVLSAGYTTLDGTTGSSGETPRELPETMYSLFVERQVNARLSYGIGLTYQDKSLIGNGSTAYLPDYTRIDASLSYLLANDMTLRVNVENLADEEYYPHAHSTHQASVGDPMNVKLSLGRKF